CCAPSRSTQAGCCRATSCSSRRAAARPPPSTARSTCRSGACARSSRSTPRIRRSSSRCAAPATSWCRRSPAAERQAMSTASDAPLTPPEGMDADNVFRTLFVAYPDALIVADAQGRIVLANPAAARLLGYELGELIGLGVDALVPDSIRPRHASYRDAYARAPRSRPMGTEMELV